MTLEELGAILGFVAFVGLAVLIFMTFQQARHLRRLRDWAGRAPERAAAVAARAGEETLPAEEYEEYEEEVEIDRGPTRRERIRGAFGERWTELDRRMPVEPKIVIGGLAAILAGVVIALSLGGGGGDDGGGAQAGSGGNGGGGETTAEVKPIKVDVLNATSPPVAGLANQLSDAVKAAGFRVGAVENSPTPLGVSVIMFQAEAEADAEEVAAELAPVLGPTEVVAMTAEVESVAGIGDVALVVGADDAGI